MTTAEVTLHGALQGDPGNWEVRLALLQQMKDRNDFAGILGLVSEAPGPPNTDSELRRVVEMCVHAQSPGMAVPILKSYLVEHPSSAVAHYLYARLLSKMGDMNRAREHYNAAVALNSELEDEVLAAKLADLGETMAHSLPRSETGALVSLHKTGRIQPMPMRPHAGDRPSSLSEPVPTAEPVVDSPSQQPVQLPQDEPISVEPVVPDVIYPSAEQMAAEATYPAEETTYDYGEYSESQGEHHEATRYLLVSEGEKVKPRDKASGASQKLSAMVIAILAHLGILALLATVVMSIPERRPPEIVTQAPPLLDDQTIEKAEVQKVVQRKPIQAASQAEVITVAGASAVAMPDLQTDLNSFDPIGMGESFGASMSFDAGEDGGMVSFFGSRSVSKKVVFAVDYSASMRPMGKDILMRKELAKSLNALPGGIQYQCIFFHGPAWYHGQTVEVNNPDKKDEWVHYIVNAEKGRDNWKWYSGYDEKSRVKKGGKLSYVFHPESGSTELDQLPKGEYISSSRSNIRKSVKIVEETPLGGGTDWRWPLYMAINMEPDTIFFMTDGAFRAKGNMLDDILDYNRKKGRAKINTICMMVPQAMDQLTYLADKSRGEVSLVLEDQTVLRGKELEDYLKSKKK